MAGNEDLNDLFGQSFKNGLPAEITGELESMQRLHSIKPQELFFKWESYCIKMGAEETKLDLDTVRMFKKDIQDSVEREHRGRAQRGSDKRATMTATPRASNSDAYGM